MTLQEQKDKADIISKLVDSLYKKLIILLAIDGAFGTYAIIYNRLRRYRICVCGYIYTRFCSDCYHLRKNEFMD